MINHNKFHIVLVIISITFLAVACGWVGNQKKAVTMQLEKGFKQGLAKQGKKADAAVTKKWAKCVTDKITKRWKSFNEFTKNQTHSDVGKFRQECAKKTKLFESIK